VLRWLLDRDRRYRQRWQRYAVRTPPPGLNSWSAVANVFAAGAAPSDATCLASSARCETQIPASLPGWLLCGVRTVMLWVVKSVLVTIWTF
jgi:hypothetical protein